MILTKNVVVTLNPKNISYYKKKYDIPEKPSGKKILVSTDDLSIGSNIKISSKCDYCGSIKEVGFKEYNRNISNNNKYSCSNKCGSIKKKEISIIKYGVESPSMLDSVKEKAKNTCINRYDEISYMNTVDFKKKSENSLISKYGVKNSMFSKEIKDKLISSNLMKYGVGNVFESTLIKDIIKYKNLEKYGYTSYSKTDEFKDKIKETCLEKYGVDNYSKTDEFRDKIKETCIERYGVNNYMLSDEFRLKSLDTIITKYGTYSYSKTDEFKDKIKETCLEKYGVNNYMLSSEFISKSEKTIFEKYGVNNYKKSEKFHLDTKIGKEVGYDSYVKDSISLFRCDEGHEFEIKSDNYLSRKKLNIPICTVCNPIGDSVSIKEKELFNFIDSIYDGKIIQSYRDGLEIDIYLPELKIGFEFNGLYWHSEEFKDKNYHLDKTKYFMERGIRIIHIWEDDWINKKRILESQISNWLGLTKNKIYARRCDIKEIKQDKVSKFLNNNHIQGIDISNIKIGMFFDNELISVMTFNKLEGRKKMKDGCWNLSRFCNKLNFSIVGGSSKMLNFFIKRYKTNRIISYADRDWSTGNLYNKLGFSLLSESNPDYKYVIDGNRKHKQNFKKSNLGIKGQKITESQFMRSKGYYRIWDCGKIKYELIKKDT